MSTSPAHELSLAFTFDRTRSATQSFRLSQPPFDTGTWSFKYAHGAQQARLECAAVSSSAQVRWVKFGLAGAPYVAFLDGKFPPGPEWASAWLDGRSWAGESAFRLEVGFAAAGDAVAPAQAKAAPAPSASTELLEQLAAKHTS